MTQATRKFDELFTFTRASTATYFDANGVLQTAGVDEPRFDHDPVTGESKGVLVEQESTNQLLHSEDLSEFVWNKSGVTIGADSATVPDGTSNGDKIIESSATGFHQLTQTITLSPSTSYSFSIFMKDGGRDSGMLVITSNGMTTEYTFFDLTNEICDGEISYVGDGWYRITSYFTTVSGGNSLIRIRLNNETGSVSYLGDGSSGFYVWGAQVEQSDAPTSYIPTTTATVTRSADSLVHDVGVRYNEPEGTWIIKANSYESTILDNVGFTTAKFTGDGTIVYRYDSTGGYLYANGQKEFNTAKPSTIDTFNIGVGGAYQWTNDLVYYPYAISENDAIALTTGSVTVDWFYPDDQSLILDFAQKKYGTRNISDAMDVFETTDFSTLLTFSRASTGRYFDSTGIMQEAAVDELRFDYDANTGEPLGVLIEEARTNLVLLSEDLTTVPWGNYGASISANATTAPDGAATADKLVEDTADDVHQRGISEVDYTTPMSFSIFAKAAERTQATLICAGIESGIIDLQTGTTSDPDVIITPAGNGWWRLAMTKTPADGTAKVYGIGMAVGGTSSYVGDGSSGIYAWGAQLEEELSSSSYIPTSGSIASRSGENLSCALSNNISSEFTMYVEAITRDIYSVHTSGIFWIHNGAGSGAAIYQNQSNPEAISFVAREEGYGSTNVGSSSPISIGLVKAAMSVDSNMGITFAANGVSGSNFTNTLVPFAQSYAEIGSSFYGGSAKGWFNSHIKQVWIIIGTRTATQLETLTT